METKLEEVWLKEKSIFLEKSFVQSFKHMAQSYKIKHNISNIETIYKILGTKKQYLSYWKNNPSSMQAKKKLLQAC